MAFSGFLRRRFKKKGDHRDAARRVARNVIYNLTIPPPHSFLWSFLYTISGLPPRGSPEAGVVDSEVDLPPGTYDYDLFVLGGGSGGAAAALEAARRGRTGQVGVGKEVEG